MPEPAMTPAVSSGLTWRQREARLAVLRERSRVLREAAGVLAAEWGPSDQPFIDRLRWSAAALWEAHKELELERWQERQACSRCNPPVVGGPSHAGSSACRMRHSLAAGGIVAHCSCAGCH